MSEETRMERPSGPSDSELEQAVPKDHGAHQLRVGAFVLLGALSFIVLLFLLTDPATFRGRYVVTTEVDNAGGLRRGDPVQMRGVNIGRVRGFTLEGQDVTIVLEIDGEWEIPQDSHTRLTPTGLLGGRVVEVVPGEAGRVLGNGEHIPGETRAGTLGTAEGLTDQAEVVMQRVESLLSEPTIEGVHASVREMESLLRTLSELTRTQSREVARLTESLNRSAQGLETAAGGGEDVARAAARADSALLELNVASGRLNRASESLQTVLTRVEQGEGTLGQLATDDALYDNLNEAALAVTRLADDIRANPRRYVNITVF